MKVSKDMLCSILLHVLQRTMSVRNAVCTVPKCDNALHNFVDNNTRG